MCSSNRSNDPSQYDQPSYYEENGHSIVPPLEWFLESKRQHEASPVGFPIEIMLDCRRAYQVWIRDMTEMYARFWSAMNGFVGR